MQTWALEGQGVKIGSHQFLAPKNTPAVIDTGTSLFALPANLFDKLVAVWREELGKQKLMCEENKAQCYVVNQCSNLKLSPVSLMFSNYLFEIKSEQYLQQSGPLKCSLGFIKNTLPVNGGSMFLVGDLFLRHYYSVFDVANNQIQLAVNTHSKNDVKMNKDYEQIKKKNKATEMKAMKQ